MSIKCPYCDRDAKLVTGSKIYPHRPDLFAKKFWMCGPCGAWVGCHPPARGNGGGGQGDGTVPLGRLANEELRRAKMQAHAAFDPIWRAGEMKRASAYKWLSQALHIRAENCHIGMMDVAQCLAVVAVCNARKELA